MMRMLGNTQTTYSREVNIVKHGRRGLKYGPVTIERIRHDGWASTKWVSKWVSK